MQTPIGPVAIRKHLVEQFATMTDREIADETFRERGFINPEAFAELCHRGLCFRGDRENDVYRRVEERESS
jgi:hypothetical protein